MNGPLFILILQVAFTLGLPVFPCDAQQLVWEEIWGFTSNSEEVSKVIPVQNSTDLLAIGKTTKWMELVGFDYFEAVVIIKIKNNGDTLFMKRLGTIPVARIAYLGHKFGNIYQAVIQSPINNNNLPVGYPCILEFTDQGELLSTQYLADYPEYRPNTCIRTADGGLILAGYYNGALTSPTNMMAIKINFLGQVEWASQYLPPVITRGIANRIEPMPNGNFLLSGTMGRRIYGFEIDSNGSQVGQKTYYETPSNRVFFNGAAPQVWRRNTFSFGQYSPASNQYKMVLHLSDSSGNKIWGGEQSGLIDKSIFINREFSLIYTSKEGSVVYVNRLKSDSTIIWKLPIITGNQIAKQINDISFSQNDTGFVAGFYVDYSNNLGNQFWIAKIAGVGTAYDPANPGDTVTVSAEERLFRPKDSPVLYPNPATEIIRFQKLTQETKVAIYSSQGQKLLEQNILPEQVLDICTLPIGTYLYHLKMGERVFTGKFLKE